MSCEAVIAELHEDGELKVLLKKSCVWLVARLYLRCNVCLRQTSSMHLSEQGAADSQQAELRINPRISKVKKLTMYSMDQRNSYTAGNCNSSAPHWIITRGKKTEPCLMRCF